MSPPPGSSGPIGPFKGDKIYVIGDFIAFLIGIGINIVNFPAVFAETLKRTQENAKPGTKLPSDEMFQTIMMATTGCIFVVILGISILLWVNMIKGKKWAFIVSIVFLILGLAMGAAGLAGAGAMGAMFGLSVGVIKLVYCILRMIGKVGPALN